MLEKEDFYWYWLCNIPGIGSIRIKRLLECFLTPEGVYHAGRQELEHCRSMTAANIAAVLNSRHEEKIYQDFIGLEKKGIVFLHKDSRNYPKRLEQLYDMPYGLYCKGRAVIEESAVVAVVGARACSEYGKRAAWTLSKEFARMGIAVVSGMAAGIDTAAHQGCIAGGGRTYAVLGCGVDICYPRENIQLYMDIQKNGCLLSEYTTGTPPAAGRFPVRNRIISGMADAVIVVEARKRSGSLITVDQALEQNKEVFVVPGRIGEALSEGCHELIKQGAQMITEPQDILQSSLIKEKIPMQKTPSICGVKEQSGKIVLATKKKYGV